MDFLHLFLAWCITNVLVNGNVLDPIRDYLLVRISPLGRMMSCVMCTGFWVGFFLSLVMDARLDSHFLYDSRYFHYISYGFISSGVSTIINSLLIFFIKEYTEKSVIVRDEKKD